MKFKDLLPYISLFLSIVSIFIVVHKEFLSKANLKIAIGNIIVIPFDSMTKGTINFNILINDLMSARPSQIASDLKKAIPGLDSLILKKNRDLVIQNFIQYTENLKNSNQPSINYTPDLNDLNECIKKSPILLNVILPISIVNIGLNTGNITTLVLEVTSASNKNEVWLFTNYYEANSDMLKEPLNQQKDITQSYLGKIFAGIHISSKSSVQLYPYFVPMPSTKEDIVNIKPIMPGNYTLKLYAYSSDGKKIAESKEENWDIEEDLYGKLFDGFLFIQNITGTKVISKHIKERRKQK